MKRFFALAVLVCALPVMAAEDFSQYQQVIPGLFVFLGVNRDGVPAEQAAPNHSPQFFVNEDALQTGVRTLAEIPQLNGASAP